MGEGLSDRVRATLETGGEAPAVAFAGTWRSWAWVKQVADQLEAALAAGGVAAGAPVGLAARNRPAQVAAFAGQIAARRTTSMIYTAQTPVGMAADVRRLNAAAILADPQDWTAELRAAAAETGSLGLALADDPDTPVRVVDGLERAGAGPHRSVAAEVAFELLSSGTTGAPKRLPLSWATVESATADAGLVYVGTAQRQTPLLMLHPIGNVAGVSYLCPALAAGQPIVLLEKFTVESWVEAVRTYRPVRSALPPAAVRMVVEAQVPREALSSLTVLAVGGARIEPELQEQFEAMYGVPVTPAFGATEFGGVVANWTLDLYRALGAAKRGSVGRASPKVALRVVDRDSFQPLPAGEVGLLEARVDRLGPHWIRTTDMASLDKDGFLFLHGRADDAINRGGFKIVPEVVAEALRRHPAVADAVVVGLADPRLGETPVAAVELKAGAETPTPDELMAFARDRLLAYQLPTAIRIVPALPRTLSMKVSAPDVRALFGRA
ncbi:fatty acid--CoA ligase family protein [Phenylobacterium sp.]|uniref:ANL family adenylate-forming protein n=1 Tax=Phenylobacterium sp. TaxID=1871053 RepID=UPI002F42C48A